MSKSACQKVKLLKIYEILKRDSDEDRPLSTPLLIKKLKEIGIDCERKTLYEDIKELNAHGYEVMMTRTQTNNYYIMDRGFDVPELRILMDAVESAKFITMNKTSELKDKIAALGGSFRGELLKTNQAKFNVKKHTNEEIYYAVSVLDSAIYNKKKASFTYFDFNEKGDKIFRKDNARYIVNPVSLVYVDDKYYLLTYNEKHESITPYRIDRMIKAQMENNDSVIDEKAKKLCDKASKAQAFSMYMGEIEDVKFEIDRSLIDVVTDKFGEEIKLKTIGDKLQFIASVQLSPMFYGWCCNFGSCLKILSPQSVIDKMKEHLLQVSSNYNS